MSDDLTRKQFIRLGAAATVALTLPACPGEDEGEDTGADSGGGDCSGDATANISTNHGHELTIPAADLAAGGAQTYTTTEGNSHTHDVSLSDQEMADIAAGVTVSAVTTSAGGHTHSLTIGC